jgi:hypothetical protein
LIKRLKGKMNSTTLFAVPVNDKLPWMIVDTVPKKYIEDKFKDRNPSHRYYIADFNEWKTTNKRAKCTILDHVGEAGNLEAESIRILR